MKRERQKRYRSKIRHNTIVAYGGCCCDCGTTNEALLEFDHIDGKGNAHRSQIFGYGHASPSSWNFYKWLRDAGYPQDLRIVFRCKDCHDVKHSKRIGKKLRGAPAWSHKDVKYEDKVPF